MVCGDGSSSTRSSGVAAETPRPDGQRLSYPEESSLCGNIQCRTGHAQDMRAEFQEKEGMERSKRKCWAKPFFP